MARGKEAAKAARRREAQAQARTGVVKERLQKEREQLGEEINELRAEILRLKNERQADAAKLAEEAILEVRQEVAQREADVELLKAALKEAMASKDYLVFNACRYMSMRDGKPPLAVLARVFTWMTEESFVGVDNTEEFLLRLALPPDGWVASHLRRSNNVLRVNKRTAREGDSLTISLDQAEEEGHKDIHEDYIPQWYAHRPAVVMFRHRGGKRGQKPIPVQVPR